MGGIIVEIVSVILAVTIAGAGHGSYEVASILFPYTMFSTRFLDRITTPFIVLALGQFPTYGVLVAATTRRWGPWTMLIPLIALHTLFAIAASFGRGGSFYP